MDRLYHCPYCGELDALDLESDVDLVSGGVQVFVRDCSVCCQPWTVAVHVSANGAMTVTVDR
jgi:hypothetical protein